MPASLVAATQSLEANTQSKETASPPAQETFLGAVGDDSFENMPIGADRSPLRRPRQPHARLPRVRPRANGTSACSLPSPSCRPASLRRSSMVPRLRTLPSPASPRPCPIRGLSRRELSVCPGSSRSRASDSHCSTGDKCRRHRSRRTRRALRNRSLSNIEPVCGTPKSKLENGAQRPAPETRPSRTEMP
jgi:hypothetical protein